MSLCVRTREDPGTDWVTVGCAHVACRSEFWQQERGCGLRWLACPDAGNWGDNGDPEASYLMQLLGTQ